MLGSECSILEELRHDNIVRHIATVTEPKTNLPILAMELMDCNLNEFIKKYKPLNSKEQYTICHGVACGLEFLHKKNYIHRDVCDANVLLKYHPKLTVKISDFGLSTILDYESTSVAMSALHYREGYFPREARAWEGSNEESDEEDDAGSEACYSHRLDVYSFGAVAIQTVQSAEYFKLERNMRKSFREIPDHHLLKEIIKRCIEKDSKLRPSTMTDVSECGPLISLHAHNHVLNICARVLSEPPY